MSMMAPKIDFDPWLTYREGDIDPVLKADAPANIKKAWLRFIRDLERSNSAAITQEELDKIIENRML